MKACCNWCNAIVKVSKDYDRRYMRAYCSQDCLEKDWLFMRWQSEEWLTYVANKRRKK